MFKIKLNNGDFLIKKEFLFIVLIFLVGFILRIAFGFFRTTGDLLNYTDLERVIVSRYGFAKQLLFYPLKIFPSQSLRFIAIAFINTLLFTICIKQLTLRSNQIINLYLTCLVSINTFFAQIDMHLVRQQICIYLFVISITQKRFNLASPLLILLSMFYHEAGIGLFISWIFAFFIKQNRLNSIKNFLFLLSVLSNTFLIFYLKETSTIFLIITSFANHFLKSESNKTSLKIGFYFFQISIFLFLTIGPYSFLSNYITEVTISRLVGLGVSYGLLLLLGNGKFKGRKNLVGNITILLLLCLYSVLNYI